MIQLHIFCEGETEQRFVNIVLRPHLFSFSIQIETVFSGGVTKYDRLKNGRFGIRNLLKKPKKNARFSTMIDLYKYPKDAPGRAEAEKLNHIPYQKVDALEKALADDFNDFRFVPYLQMHEFEALLLVEPSKLISSFQGFEKEILALAESIKSFDSPELIDEGEHSAPSKRIINFVPDYIRGKSLFGPQVAAAIGLPAICAKCPHFNAWIQKLEKLSTEETSTGN